jgi:hypothetical protein
MAIAIGDNFQKSIACSIADTFTGNSGDTDPFFVIYLIVLPAVQ